MEGKSKYYPSHIANYFLWRAWEEDINVTPMKLIKLIYIAYGWNLAINNERLFDEKILAWAYGPVIPSIYHEFKRFANKPVNKDEYSTDYNYVTGQIESVNIVSPQDEQIQKLAN